LIEEGLSFAQVAKQQTASSALCTQGPIRASFVNKRRMGKIAPSDIIKGASKQL